MIYDEFGREIHPFIAPMLKDLESITRERFKPVLQKMLEGRDILRSSWIVDHHGKPVSSPMRLHGGGRITNPFNA